MNKTVAVAVKRALVSTDLQDKAKQVRSMREGKIRALQREMLKMTQAELPTEHFFADGMYLRYLPRKAGTLIVGKEHKHAHFYLVMSGRVRVAGPEGSQDFVAPAVIVSQPGTKRAVLALEDSVCATVHRTDKTDLNDIEADLIVPDETAAFDAANKVKQEALPCLG